MRNEGSRARAASRAGEEGFALILVLFVLVGLTAMATAGFLSTDSEYQVSESHASNLHAFNAASAGLHEYLGTSITGVDTLVFSYPNATATAWGEQMLTLTPNREMLRISADAQYVSPVGDTASRRLHTFAVHTLKVGNLNAQAALASGAGIDKNGGAGTISGFDVATTSDCPTGGTADKAGVAVPPGGYNQNGGSSVPEGSPDIDESQTGIDLLNATGIDWNDIVNQGGINPDYTVPPDTWPNLASLPPNEWPLIYVTSPNATLGPGESGRGVIIARYDVTMSGNFDWDGIMLVGGAVISDGFQEINGATVTGLNLLLGESVSDTDLGNGNKVFQYHSCNVLAAQQALTVERLHEEPSSLSEQI